ncbi:MAG TPA: hypothetical protein P5268_00845 [Candidatus Marinimicrobia bacterium]|nr:hypothetical protein [Candidatus Neomarinimicrobiota bacterium]HRS51202.1 hypothetical protein [Candidatus Neomarinimicrobiota bacterium]HRU91560.1 hypothetical protein [Candidatus Neomarinimicrobiota bacterium]
MKRGFLFLLVFILFININCDITSSNSDKVDEDYPTTIFPLSDDEWQVLQNEFDALNNSTVQTKLNKYGLTGKMDISKIHPNPGIKIDESKALDIAAKFVVKNSKFTNVTDSLEFINRLNRSNVLEEDSTEWKLRFSSQIYKGYEIKYSEITILLYGDGVRLIYGSWYKDIYIPERNNYSIDEAKKKIIGQSIIWYGTGGEPYEFIVSPESISEPIEKVIFPLEQDTSLEFRIVWKIPILFGGFVGWHIYFDTTTGEIVAIIQKFQT